MAQVTYEKVVHNWGWAIGFRLNINLALLRSRISSMKSALKMQKVAPQIKAYPEKYKSTACAIRASRR